MLSYSPVVDVMTITMPLTRKDSKTHLRHCRHDSGHKLKCKTKDV